MGKYGIFLVLLLLLTGCTSVDIGESTFLGTGQYWTANFTVEHISDSIVAYSLNIIYNEKYTKNEYIENLSYMVDWPHKDVKVISDNIGNETLVYEGEDNSVTMKVKVSFGETINSLLLAEEINQEGRLSDIIISEMSDQLTITINWDKNVEKLLLKRMDSKTD